MASRRLRTASVASTTSSAVVTIIPDISVSQKVYAKTIENAYSGSK
jgi:hypothetical protein